MLKHIISEIVHYEQVAKDANMSPRQRDHARLMAAGLCAYLIRVHHLNILEIIAMIEIQDRTDHDQ